MKDPLPWLDAPYSVKRHGVTITNCDDEPVHTPGCVQSHGALLAIRATDLTILQASENTKRWIGLEPAELLGRPISVVIGPDGEERVRDQIANEPLESNPLRVFTFPGADDEPLDLVIHAREGVVILEFESAGARDEGFEPNYYTLVKKTVARLHSAIDARSFLDLVGSEIRTLTRYERVVIYKFHDDGSGEVVAESKGEGLASWLGLRYPAQDIPLPARKIFQRIWLRPVPDAEAELHEIVPLINPDTGKPLDMTHCSLRGASVMYTEYLRNLKVRATLTMPIRHGRELWGLIACHQHSRAAHRPHHVRVACEFLAQVVSLQHRAVEARQSLAHRVHLETIHNQLVTRAAREGCLGSMTEGRPNLLYGVEGVGGAAVIQGSRLWTVGRVPSGSQIETLVGWLRRRPELQSESTPIFQTEELSRLHPPAMGYGDIGSGLLAASLSRVHDSMLLWFRPEVARQVDWAGDPNDKPKALGPNGPRLTPRVSFEIWRESVRGRSLPWNRVEIESAARLRLLVMELVVSRFEGLAELNFDSSRSDEELDAFAYVPGHDLNESVRGIYKYAQQLLDSARELSEEDRKRAEGLLRLTVRMDGLLNSLIHFSRLGRARLAIEDVSVDEALDEAIERVAARAAEVPSRIRRTRSLGRVDCDRDRLREILVHLISNALKYNLSRERLVEVGRVDSDEPADRSLWPEAARGELVFFVRDNGIGIETRHCESVFKMFKRLHGRTEYGGGAGAGLAIVKQLVERHKGTIWIDSRPGEGSTFYFSFPRADAGDGN